MEGFLATIMDIVLLSGLVLLMEQIKKLQKPETVKKLKAKKFYLILFIVLCLPLAVIVCMKNGVFDNTVLVIIGIVLRTFFIMATFGTAFYDVIYKKLLKKKEDMNE